MTRTIRVTLALAGTAALVGWMVTRSERPGSVAAVREEVKRAAESGPKVSPLELRLGDLAALSGHVRDTAGREVAGATVCAGSDWRELSQSEREERVCVLSEDDGSYRVEGLLAVPYFVQASAAGFVPGRFKGVVTLRVGQESEGVDVILRSGGVELKGVVRDHSGGELEGALVACEDAQVRSGVDGSFALWVAPGTVHLSARAEGYAPERASGVAPGQSFELSLTPESVLIGRVVRASDGAPLVGAQVRVQKSTGWARAGPAVTDDAGEFRLEGLKPGAYKAEALHDEAYGMAEESAVLGLGETARIEIVAHPAHLVEGTVRFEDEAACAGGFAGLRDGGDRRRAVIEADGSLRFKGVLAGTYELELECKGAVPREERVVVEDRALSGLRWQVQRGRAIRGKVVLRGGEGVPGVWVDADAQVDAAASLATSPAVRMTRTELSGEFEITGLSPGRYKLISHGEGYPRSERPVMVELAAGRDVAGVKISLPATGELRGVVVDKEERPARATEVDLRDEGGSTLLATRTADDGSFRLAHVPAREYRVVAAIGPQTLRGVGGEAVKIVVGQVQEVRLVVESQVGKISGRVIDEDGGPLVDAFVEAVPESAGGGSALQRLRWWSASGLARAPRLTDVNGRFELTQLGEGPYTIVAQRGGGGEGSIEHVAVGSSVELRISEAGSIAGVVRLAGGGAPQRFRVTVEESRTGFTASDDFFRTSGGFRFPEVPEGAYVVTVESVEGMSVARTSVPEGGRAEVQIELAPRATVRGQVIDAETGAPVAGVRVVMAPARGARSMSAAGVTDEAGRFELAGVPSGTVQATLEAQDGRYAWTAVLVEVAGSGPVVEVPALRMRRLE